MSTRNHGIDAYEIMTIARGKAEDDERFRRGEKPFIVLNEVGLSGGSVSMLTPRAGRKGSPQHASAVAGRRRMGPAVRILVTYRDVATPMPSTFIAR